MKRILIILGISLLIVISSFSEHLQTAKLTVSTTKADTTFEGDVRWEQVSIWFDSCSAWIQVATSGDTAGLSSRDSVLVPEGYTISFDRVTKLKRIRYWSTSGTGILNMLGSRIKDHN